MIQVEKVSKKEKHIAEMCVVSTEYLASYALLHRPQLIKSNHNLLVIDMCLGYFATYEEAPKKQLMSLIDVQLDKGQLDDDDVDWLISFEKQIEMNATINHKYWLDDTVQYLIGVYDDGFQKHLKDSDDTKSVIMTYMPPELPKIISVNPFHDKDAITRAAKSTNKVTLVKMPGALGNVVNQHCTAGGFICLFGPAKRGKSWWLMEFVRRGLFQQQRAWHVSISDMLEDEVIVRFGHMSSGLPTHKTSLGIHKQPVLDCLCNQLNECTDPCDVQVLAAEGGTPADYTSIHGYEVCKEHCDKFKGAIWYKDVECDKVLNEPELQKAWVRFARKARGNTNLEIFTALAGEFTPSILEKWYDEAEVKPTMVVIDYADLVYDDINHTDDRSRFNAVFMKLNNFTKRTGCMIVTASQTNASGFSDELITEVNFSGDKRKLDHITAAIGLNQTPEEKEKGFMRLNVFLSRHAQFHTRNTAKVLQDLTVGRVYISSYQ